MHTNRRSNKAILIRTPPTPSPPTAGILLSYEGYIQNLFRNCLSLHSQKHRHRYYIELTNTVTALPSATAVLEEPRSVFCERD